MSKRFFKKWTAIVICWILFCIFQMFFSNISRFTIICAYGTNAMLMVFIWLHGWEAYKIGRKRYAGGNGASGEVEIIITEFIEKGKNK